MKFRERVEANPLVWLISAGAGGFIAGLVVMLGVMQIIISDRGPRDRNAGSATPADRGNMEMTIQQFTRQYFELDGKVAEQEAFLKRADRKRVRWRVIFISPLSQETEVTVYFQLPADLQNESAPISSSLVRWAVFPADFRDRVYSLKRGDLIEISGVLKSFGTYVTIQGDDFDFVTTPTLTPTPTIKESG